MNLRTTLVLLILVIAGGLLFFVGPALLPDPSAGPIADLGSRTVLHGELKDLKRIQINRGGEQIVFERGPDGWTLPGGWPTRKTEVDRLVALISGLDTRFAPIPLEAGKEKAYGLDKPALSVDVQTETKEYRLLFGEEPAADNRFSRATYVQLADRDGAGWKPREEAVRLGPGVIAALDRPVDYYQQRRLFPHDRVAKDSGGPGNFTEKVDQLKAAGLEVKGPKAAYTLDRKGDDWTITAPVRDRPDPDKVKTILRSVADVWAERFVAQPKSLADYGLDKPEQTIIVQPQGATRPTTLLIGKEGGELKKQVTKAPPPGLPPGLAGPTTETVVEKLRYAKLADNDLVFEIRTDPLKDIFVELKDLRDPKVASFNTSDAQRLTITPPGGTAIELVKQDGKWRLSAPQQAAAEDARVTELLDRLSGLRASGDDIIDNADLKTYGLEPPAGTLTVEVEEEVKASEPDAPAEKKKRTLTFRLGKDDKEKKKLYVQVEGWPRVNAVDDEVLTLVNRPAIAYRGRDIFDFPSNDLAGIAVKQPGEQFALAQKDGIWRLSQPVDAEADSSRASKLAGDLSRLTAVEYLAAEAKPDELEKEYGLTQDALAVTLTFKEETKKAPMTLRIGKSRPGKEEFFARLDGEPGVFTVGKQLHDDLLQPSLAYRPTTLWQIQPSEIVELRVQPKDEPEYHIVKADKGWKVAGPFTSDVDTASVQRLFDHVAPLRADRFVAHAGKDGKEYGLDQPHVTITVLTGPPDIDKKEAKPVQRILRIGNETKDGPAGRYAQVNGSDAVFVLNLLSAAALDQQAVDLLDRQLLAVDPKTINKVESVTSTSRLTLERKDDAWQVTSAAPPFKPDAVKLDGMLSVWNKLQADRIVAYGAKLDWAKYGLAKPATFVTITAQSEKDAKPVLHSIGLGLPVSDGKGERYARVDEGPAVVVLSESVVKELSHIPLDFVDHQLLSLNPASITALQRRMGTDELEIVRGDDGWHITRPVMQRADDPALDQLAKDLASLRALRVVGYHTKDLRAFGLDDPAAVLTIRYLADGKPAEKVVKIGETADPPGAFNGDRFAMVEGTPIVGTLPGSLVKLLVARPVAFRDRAIARFANADRIILERGPRIAVFENVDGSWQQIQPVKAPAEQAGLDEFISAVARLRADELVADKPQPTPEELQPFGLDRPQARWRFLSGDKEVLALTIGGKEKVKNGEAERVYARAGDGDLVFLLSPAVSKQVLGEYRQRALWPAVDAFQVDRVDFLYPTNPFTLLKEGADWRVAGQPNVKLQAQAVNDAVATLANLKAERTVLDHDADLKLFGLDTPALVIDVQAGAGAKRTLAIGNPEGDSKRRYARVVGGSRDDVFVLAESDVAKVFKSLADLQAK